MFAPPEVIETEVFAELPAAYRSPTRPSEWLQGQPQPPCPFSLLEGPSFDPEGNLWVVDVPFGRIFRISPAGDWTQVADYDGEPNGLKFHRDGRIFIADYKHGIMQLDPASGAVTPVLQRVRLERLKACNDLVFGSNGDLYFTDQGLTGYHDPSGRVYRMRASGEVDCLLDRVPSPNGLVLSLDEQTLYVAVTRANAIWRVPLMPDGGVAKVGTFIQLSGGGGPDGLALDQSGGLAVAHIGIGAVWIFSPRGEPLYRVNSCRSPHLTNLAYGGADRRDLYITDGGSGAVLRARVAKPGRPMYSHQ
jgi:gluconolactonase